MSTPRRRHPPLISWSPARHLAVLAAAVVAGSCGGTNATSPKDAPLAAVTITPQTVALTAIGATVQLTGKATTASGTEVSATLSWSSSDDTIASVSSTGLVTAVSPGSVTITATTGTVSGTVSASVTQQVSSMDLSRSTASFNALGDSLDVTATPKDANGNAVDSAAVAWSSSDPSVASVVTGTGLQSSTVRIESVGDGTATITGTAGGVTANVSVSVQQVAATAEVVLPKTVYNKFGTTQAKAHLFDANHRKIPGAKWTWASTNTTVADVDTTGLVTFNWAGKAGIKATDQVSGLSARATATLDLTLAPGDVAKGRIPVASWVQQWGLDPSAMNNIVMWSDITPDSITFRDDLASWVVNTGCTADILGYDVQDNESRAGQLLVSPLANCGHPAEATFAGGAGETGDYLVGLSVCGYIRWGVNFSGTMDDNSCLVANGENAAGQPYMVHAVVVHVDNLQAGVTYTATYWKHTGNLDPALYVFGPPENGQEFRAHDVVNTAIDSVTQVTFTPDVNGSTYSFLLTNKAPDRTGIYEFDISPAPPSASGPAPVGSSIGSLVHLSPTGDVTPPAVTLAHLRALGITPAPGGGPPRKR